MKTPIILTIVCLFAHALFGGSAYQDQPIGLTAKGLAVIARYEEQARKTLPHFDEELKRPNGRAFSIVTKIYGKKHLFEQIYVRVNARDPAGYKGRIESEPTGLVEFKKGAEIFVTVDWCIVLPSGEEEGNLTGKAMDALRVRLLVFVLSMAPENGAFSKFIVVSVKNSQTRQSIRELVPEDVVSRVELEAKKRWGGLKAQDEKVKYQFVIVRFPEWEIMEK